MTGTSATALASYTARLRAAVMGILRSRRGAALSRAWFAVDTTGTP